jgi:hypothetical protein
MGAGGTALGGGAGAMGVVAAGVGAAGVEAIFGAGTDAVVAGASGASFCGNGTLMSSSMAGPSNWLPNCVLSLRNVSLLIFPRRKY